MQFAAFGLMWRCDGGRATWGEIALPSSDVPVGAGEVVIEAGSLRSSDADWLSGLSYPERGQAVFSVPGVAQFFIRQDAITVHKLEGADPQTVQAYLLGWAVGGVLHMGGILPLHGSAVRQPDGGAAVICGDSGAGKSTTLTALAQRGVPCVADDVSAIQFDQQGQAWVYPGLARAKLWGHALAQLGLPPVHQILPDMDKYYVDLPVCSEPLRLSSLYELVTQQGGTVRAESIAGTRRITTLLKHTYRPMFVSTLGLQADHMTRVNSLAPQLQMSRIVRPLNEPTLHDVVDLVMQGWA